MAHDPATHRILIVEDEVLVAMYLEDILSELSYQVAEIVTRIDRALEFASTAEFHFAVLDVNVSGTKSFPVADILRQRGIPFVFATGYGIAGMEDGYRDETVLKKPYSAKQIEQALEQAFSKD